MCGRAIAHARAGAIDDDFVVDVLAVPPDAERGHAREHHLRVLGFEQPYLWPLIALLTGYTTEITLELISAWAFRRRPRFLGRGPRGMYEFLLPTHITALAVNMLLYAHNQILPVIFGVFVGVAGKHVFLEKPMAVELREADELIAISRKNGVKFTIGYSQRFNHKFAYVRKSIADGTIISRSITSGWLSWTSLRPWAYSGLVRLPVFSK